jgi:hypothetical protein
LGSAKKCLVYIYIYIRIFKKQELLREMRNELANYQFHFIIEYEKNIKVSVTVLFLHSTRRGGTEIDPGAKMASSASGWLATTASIKILTYSPFMTIYSSHSMRR